MDHQQGKSCGEQVAAWAANSRVVKIFNTTGFENMANPKYAGVDRAFDPIRNDPRFHVALKRVSLVPEADEVVSR